MKGKHPDDPQSATTRKTSKTRCLARLLECNSDVSHSTISRKLKERKKKIYSSVVSRSVVPWTFFLLLFFFFFFFFSFLESNSTIPQSLKFLRRFSTMQFSYSSFCWAWKEFQNVFPSFPILLGPTQSPGATESGEERV